MLCGNCEDYVRFVFYQLFGPVNQRQNCKGWERSGDLGASRLSGELRDYQVIIKLKFAWVSRSMILTPVTLPWLSLSVILAKTSIKGLILIIKSTYQGWSLTWALYTQCAFLSVGVTHECRYALSGTKPAQDGSQCLFIMYGQAMGLSYVMTPTSAWGLKLLVYAALSY